MTLRVRGRPDRGCGDVLGRAIRFDSRGRQWRRLAGGDRLGRTDVDAQDVGRCLNAATGTRRRRRVSGIGATGHEHQPQQRRRDDSAVSKLTCHVSTPTSQENVHADVSGPTLQNAGACRIGQRRPGVGRPAAAAGRSAPDMCECEKTFRCGSLHVIAGASQTREKRTNRAKSGREVAVPLLPRS